MHLQSLIQCKCCWMNTESTAQHLLALALFTLITYGYGICAGTPSQHFKELRIALRPYPYSYMLTMQLATALHSSFSLHLYLHGGHAFGICNCLLAWTWLCKGVVKDMALACNINCYYDITCIFVL